MSKNNEDNIVRFPVEETRQPGINKFLDVFGGLFTREPGDTTEKLQREGKKRLAMLGMGAAGVAATLGLMNINANENARLQEVKACVQDIKGDPARLVKREDGSISEPSGDMGTVVKYCKSHSDDPEGYTGPYRTDDEDSVLNGGPGFEG